MEKEDAPVYVYRTHREAEEAIKRLSQSGLDAALTRIGVPRDRVVTHERNLKADKFILTVHGSAEDQARGRALLTGARVWETS